MSSTGRHADVLASWTTKVSPKSSTDRNSTITSASNPSDTTSCSVPTTTVAIPKATSAHRGMLPVHVATTRTRETTDSRLITPNSSNAERYSPTDELVCKSTTFHVASAPRPVPNANANMNGWSGPRERRIPMDTNSTEVIASTPSETPYASVPYAVVTTTPLATSRSRAPSRSDHYTGPTALQRTPRPYDDRQSAATTRSHWCHRGSMARMKTCPALSSPWSFPTRGPRSSPTSSPSWSRHSTAAIWRPFGVRRGRFGAASPQRNSRQLDRPRRLISASSVVSR